MKKIIILSAAILTFAVAANAQEAYVKNEIKSEKKEIKKDRKVVRKMEGEEVSDRAKQAFHKDFGDMAGATWKRGSDYDEVTFTQNNVATTAYYDYNAKLIGTTTPKTFADLPAAAQKTIEKKYGDYTKEAVLFFDDNEDNDTDMILYGVQFNDEDNYFIELSKNGKRIVLKANPAGEISFLTVMK